MPNDAKLGLVVGMGLVMTVAVMFFRKDVPPATPPGQEVSAIGANSATASPAADPLNPVPADLSPRGLYRPVKARTANRSEDAGTLNPTALQHTVREGDTLFSLAKRYYDDPDKCVDIYRANREVLKDPDHLAPGTVLVIPDAPADAGKGEEP